MKEIVFILMLTFAPVFSPAPLLYVTQFMNVVCKIRSSTVDYGLYGL